MVDASTAETGELLEIEHISLDKLTPEQVQEFMPGWVYQPEKKLKSGGKGLTFSREIGDKTWETSIDKSYPAIKLTSSAGDNHIIKLNGPLPVLLNRRNHELVFRDGENSQYRIWRDQHRYRGKSSGVDEAVVMLIDRVEVPPPTPTMTETPPPTLSALAEK